MSPRVQISVSRSSSRCLTDFAVDFPLSALPPRHFAWTRHPGAHGIFQGLDQHGPIYAENEKRTIDILSNAEYALRMCNLYSLTKRKTQCPIAKCRSVQGRMISRRPPMVARCRRPSNWRF
jgi:hypothetical protein